MEKFIETLLLGSIYEEDTEQDKFAIESLNSMQNLLQNGTDIFHDVADQIFISMQGFEEVEEKSGIDVGLMKDFVTDNGQALEKHLKFFDVPGVMLHEGIHASAFGRLSYIYRTKGMRLYYFKDGTFKILTPYCTIDHHGFDLKQEVIFDFSITNIKDRSDVSELFINYKMDAKEKGESLNYSRHIISVLAKIKKDFNRDYFLEHLITPPDVDLISDFSQEFRIKIWEVCLSERFLKKWGEKIQHAAMNILSSIQISPSTGQLIAFIKRNEEKPDLAAILERLETMESNIVAFMDQGLNRSTDLIDFKPNIAGIGININEVIKRLKDSF